MLTRKTVVLVKLQEELGVDPVPTPTANALRVRDLSLRPVGEALKRDFYRDDLSPDEFVRGERYWQCSFETELVGPGSAGALPAWGWLSPLLQSCGLKETVSAGTKISYAPESFDVDEQPCCTIYVYRHGLFRPLTDCRGTMSIIGEVGKFGAVKFDMYGLWIDPSDVENPTPTLSTVKPPTIVSAGLTMGGYQAKATKIELSLNNTVSQRRSMDAPTGLLGHVITAREPGGSLDPEAVLEATHAFWANWKSATAVALNWGPIGTAAGNKVKVTAPKMQYDGLADGDRDGIMTYDVGFKLARNAGNDEILIEFE